MAGADVSDQSDDRSDGQPPAPLAPEPSSRPVRRALLIAVVAVLCTLPSASIRWSAEGDHPGVELAATDSAVRLWDAQKVADTHKKDATAQADLAAAGVKTVVVGMRPVDEAVARGQLVEVDAAAVGKAGLAKKLPAGGTGVWLRSVPGDPSGTWSTLDRMLRARVAASGGAEKESAVRVSTPAGWVGYLRFVSSVDVGQLPAGFDRARLTALHAAGTPVVLALPPRSPAPEPWLAAEMNAAATVAQTTRVMVTSGQTFPDEASTDALAAAVARPGRTLVIPDDVDDGSTFAAYVDAAPGRTVRAHFVPFDTESTDKSLIERGRRATKERGDRMVVVQPPASTSTEPPSVPADVGLRSLAKSMPVLTAWNADMPTSIGEPSPAPVLGKAAPLGLVLPDFVARGLALVGGFLVFAGAVYAMTEVRVRWYQGIHRALNRPVAAVVFCVWALAGVATWLHPMRPVTQALMLAIAVTGAAAAVLVALTGQPPPPRTHDRVTALRWAGYVGRFATAVAFATAAGWVIGAMAASNHYLVLSDSFAGDGLLLLAPLVIVGAIAFGASRAQLTYTGETFDVDLVRHRVLLGVVGVVVVGCLVLYLVRAGVTATGAGGVSSPELWVRDWLDDALYVRPRFKEIIIGAPALVLALRWPGVIGRWVCATIAAIGTTSIVNTFVHFSEPLSVSLLRTGYGALGGLILGLLLSMAVPAIVGPLRDALRTRTPDDEAPSGAL